MWRASGALLWGLWGLCGLAAAAGAEPSHEPLSAIDWLSRSVSASAAPPVPRAEAPGPAAGAQPAAAALPAPGTITMRSLDAPSLDGLGLMPAARAGLPRDLWGVTPSTELARLIRAERVDTLPSVQALLYTLLLAELAPPADSDGSGALFLARIDKLLDLGALDPAMALLERVEKPESELFRRWFDIALLTGREDRACEVMLKTPEIAPTFPARVFCLARSGDWNAAALSLRIGETLGYVDRDMAELLERFLDPELFEGEPDLPPPSRPSPLVFRLMEAIGQPLPTTTLPVAFAQSELRGKSGWKARLEAGERLARTGAIPANQLLGLYGEREPAASGGIWERVRLVQGLERALARGDAATAARLLPDAWARMAEVELEVPFASLFGERLDALDLDGEPGRIAFHAGLLSDAFETVARRHQPAGPRDRFLIALATARVEGIAPPDPMGAAVLAAFRSPADLPEDLARLSTERRLGEALLKAIDRITDGARGDLRNVSEGLALLRSLGLETTARRAALELVLLERRG
ncbi:hypothetical protein [Albidovulum sp.]